MSRYLLDTHVIIWLATNPNKIPSNVLKTLENAKELNISAASAFQIAQKSRLGKLQGGTAILNKWPELMKEIGAQELPLRSRDLIIAGSMGWEHKDPFDRMIVATAGLHGLVLVTKDSRLQSYKEISCVQWK